MAGDQHGEHDAKRTADAVGTGDSGTSFKSAPAIGKCLSDLVLEGAATTVDLYPFRPSHFAEGQPWVDEHDYGLKDVSVSR